MDTLPRDFADYWQTTRAELDAAFGRWLPRFFRGLPDDELAAIAQALDDGKRLRACLLCLVSDVLGGRREAALPRAVAIECIQAASLIHDDFVDQDTHRRGRPAAWKALGPRRAILLGDLIFATALQRMVEAGSAEGAALAAVIATMANGAWQEPLEPGELERVAAEGAERARELYPRILYLKTGALFGTATRLGALAAAAPPEVADVAFEFGVYVGEAYQIADDLRDLVDAGSGESEPQATALAPAIMHFCGAARGSEGPLANGCMAALARIGRPELRRRMHRAIEERVARAGRCAGGLPPGRYGDLLRDAAPQVVRIMLSS
jgi:geranylgeranyl pyrophosphate synthase